MKPQRPYGARAILLQGKWEGRIHTNYEAPLIFLDTLWKFVRLMSSQQSHSCNMLCFLIVWNYPLKARISNSKYLCHFRSHACSVGYWCPTLCDPTDCSPPGSNVRGILLARMLAWVASSCSRGSSQTRGQTYISCTGSWIFALWATWEAPL